MDIFRDLSDLNFDSPIVLTLGNFDGVHMGHRQIIDRVLELGKRYNLPTAMFTFSVHPMQHFGSDVQSIQSEKDKIDLLESLGIDYLIYIPFTTEVAGMSPEIFVREVLINRLRSQFVVVGYDFHFGRKRTGDYELLSMMAPKLGYKAIKIDKFTVEDETASSTNIRNHLNDGDVTGAAKLLGRPFSVSGEVVRGDGIGRLLGFPTANVQIGDVITPKNGVYATRVTIGNEQFDSITSVGVRPTVGKSAELRVEAHIFDFNEDIYNQHIQVEFIQFVREEAQFGSFEDLKAQIHADCEAVKKLNR